MPAKFRRFTLVLLIVAAVTLAVSAPQAFRMLSGHLECVVSGVMHVQQGLHSLGVSAAAVMQWGVWVSDLVLVLPAVMGPLAVVGLWCSGVETARKQQHLEWPKGSPSLTPSSSLLPLLLRLLAAASFGGAVLGLDFTPYYTQVRALRGSDPCIG